jgi:hypothetical protein
LVNDELGVVREVLEDQQAERGGGHTSTSVRPATLREYAPRQLSVPLLFGTVTCSSSIAT